MNRKDFLGNSNVVSMRVRKAREDRKLSQKKLAERMQVMGVSIDQQAISLLEHNQRSVSDFELKCIASILEVSTEWLLSDFDEIVTASTAKE